MQEGFEGGLFTLEEAQKRNVNLRKIVNMAQDEARGLEQSVGPENMVPNTMEDMRVELRRLRDQSLDEANFDRRLEMIACLGVTVHPSEDLKSLKVKCNLVMDQSQSSQTQANIGNMETGTQFSGSGEQPSECGIVLYAPPHSIPTPKLSAGAPFSR